jgi:hypothetical protein
MKGEMATAKSLNGVPFYLLAKPNQNRGGRLVLQKRTYTLD